MFYFLLFPFFLSFSVLLAQPIHYNANKESTELMTAFALGEIQLKVEQTTFFEAEELNLTEYALKVGNLCNSISEVNGNYLDESVKRHFYSRLVTRIDLEREMLLLDDPNWAEFKKKFSKEKLIKKIEMRDGVLFFVVDDQSRKPIGAYNLGRGRKRGTKGSNAQDNNPGGLMLLPRQESVTYYPASTLPMDHHARIAALWRSAGKGVSGHNLIIYSKTLICFLTIRSASRAFLTAKETDFGCCLFSEYKVYVVHAPQAPHHQFRPLLREESEGHQPSDCCGHR